MKLFLLVLFLLGVLCCYAQDVIKLSGSDPINCKIISVDKDEIVFLRNGTQRKANTAYVVYYKFNESVKEKFNPDSVQVARPKVDTITTVSTPEPIPGSIQLSPSPQSAGDYLVNAGKHFRSGLTLMLLGSAAVAVSPLAITSKEVDKEFSSGGTTVKYKELEVDYTGMQVLMGAGVILEVIGIVELFVASSDLENAGNKLNNKSGLSFNGSLQRIQIAYRF